LILQTIRDMYSQNVERDMYCHFNSQISLMFMSYVKKYTHGEHSTIGGQEVGTKNTVCNKFKCLQRLQCYSVAEVVKTVEVKFILLIQNEAYPSR
jgi:hypothetical protein